MGGISREFRCGGGRKAPPFYDDNPKITIFSVSAVKLISQTGGILRDFRCGGGRKAPHFWDDNPKITEIPSVLSV